MRTFLTIFLSVLFAQENGGPNTSDENTVLLMHFDGDATNSPHGILTEKILNNK